MDIKEAKFEISNADAAKCPDTSVPEYAFIGRSNVGKSSLINMLTRRKSLAKTSQTPGKTLLINHFSINGGEWYLVDVSTKADKVGVNAARRNVDEYKAELLKHWEALPPVFITSSERHQGRDELLDYIDSLNREMAASPQSCQEEEKVE